ncbi:porphobilinogen synthase [Candidatus Poribacteria bacterium]|nr:porphobilinogen synthase [Candidatus Poribacteria bacterium]
MRYPIYRPRRLRTNENLRRLIREINISADDLIMPLFVRPGKGVRNKISSMPGNFQLSVDELVKEGQKAVDLGIPAVILFGIPERKDAVGSEGYKKGNIVAKAVSALKDKVEDLIVITDVCLCEYTDHGHCGVVKKKKGGKDFSIDNDATLELLARMALSHVEAGADMVAPSDMMDGRIGAVRSALDAGGFLDTPIMAYAAKYASAFYGPFREAAESPPKFGDRRSYQMDPPNTDEAIREVALDIEEGADIVMVKPALPYLDVIYRVKQEFGYPVAAYNVSGEFSLVKAAAERKWVDEQKLVIEILTSIKRAGADMILTYHAMEVASWLK